LCEIHINIIYFSNDNTWHIRVLPYPTMPKTLRYNIIKKMNEYIAYYLWISCWWLYFDCFGCFHRCHLLLT